MRKIKEVLRLYFEQKQSIRQISRSCTTARSTIQEYLHRAEQAEVTWLLPPEMDDAALESRLFPPLALMPPENRQMPPPGVPAPGTQKERRHPDAPLVLKKAQNF
jgi:hypothetical protein